VAVTETKTRKTLGHALTTNQKSEPPAIKHASVSQRYSLISVDFFSKLTPICSKTNVNAHESLDVRAKARCFAADRFNIVQTYSVRLI